MLNCDDFITEWTIFAQDNILIITNRWNIFFWFLRLNKPRWVSYKLHGRIRINIRRYFLLIWTAWNLLLTVNCSCVERLTIVAVFKVIFSQPYPNFSYPGRIRPCVLPGTQMAIPSLRFFQALSLLPLWYRVTSIGSLWLKQIVNAVYIAGGVAIVSHHSPTALRFRWPMRC